MFFADIHNHILFGVDDGAKSVDEMFQLIDSSYNDGVKVLCCTPHYHPVFFDSQSEQILKVFNLARRYVREHYSDLRLFLGSELRYEYSCTEWVDNGRCHTLNGTNNLLVDFAYSEKAQTIIDAMLHVLNGGFTPILAHAERYEHLHKDFREIKQLKSWGVIIQVDAQSPLGDFGLGVKKRSHRLLDHGLVDVIASDAHNLITRAPQLKLCSSYISRKYGKDYAHYLFWDKPLQILNIDYKL